VAHESGVLVPEDNVVLTSGGTWSFPSNDGSSCNQACWCILKSYKRLCNGRMMDTRTKTTQQNCLGTAEHSTASPTHTRRGNHEKSFKTIRSDTWVLFQSTYADNHLGNRSAHSIRLSYSVEMRSTPSSPKYLSSLIFISILTIHFFKKLKL
jgi:hypothetical protein